MPTQIPSNLVTLLGRRTRQELVETLIRAHRARDTALVCQCQTELDRQTRMHTQITPKTAASRR